MEDDDKEMERIREAYKEVFSSEAGKVVFSDLMDACMFGCVLLAPSTKDGAVDPLILAGAASRVEIAYHIRNRMKMD